MAFLRDKSVYCIPGTTFQEHQKYVIGGICIATSSVGFLGAGLQLKSLWQYRDRQRRRPSVNPRIIFYLALSDLVACVGVFALAVCFTKFDSPKAKKHPSYTEYIPRKKLLYESVVTILEVMTLFSYLASYIWTFSYALDMFFQIFQIECPMIVYHILAWLIPVDLIVCIEGVNFGQYGSSECQRRYGRMNRIILSYIPVMAVIVGNSVLLFFTYRKIKQISRSCGTGFTRVGRTALTKCKRKFFWMVFVFSLCWLPNIYSVCSDLHKLISRESKEEKLQPWRLGFVYVEAFLNPLQGMLNYFVYRNSFKVTATDTRPAKDCLPRVPCPSSLDRYLNGYVATRKSTNQSVQKFVDSLSTHDEESSLLGSSDRTNNYIYVSRLLGE